MALGELHLSLRFLSGVGASLSIPISFCLFFSGQSGAAGLDSDLILEFVFGLVSSLRLFSSQFNQFLEFRFNPGDAWWGGWIMDPGIKVFTTFFVTLSYFCSPCNFAGVDLLLFSKYLYFRNRVWGQDNV